MPPAIASPAYVDSPIPLNTCKCCKAPAEIFREKDGTYIAECSDTVLCKDWPQTEKCATAEAAAKAWNKGEVK